MIKITIEGPQGSGKGIISQKIIQHIKEQSMSYLYEQDGIVEGNNSEDADVIIIEKQKRI